MCIFPQTFTLGPRQLTGGDSVKDPQIRNAREEIQMTKRILDGPMLYPDSEFRMRK